jgi:hypothetical protein
MKTYRQLTEGKAPFLAQLNHRNYAENSVQETSAYNPGNTESARSTAGLRNTKQFKKHKQAHALYILFVFNRPFCTYITPVE